MVMLSKLDADAASNIRDQHDYERALALIDELFDDYDANASRIEILSAGIARWEDRSPEFDEFNKTVRNIESQEGQHENNDETGS